jgi:hypothetical protein
MNKEYFVDRLSRTRPTAFESNNYDFLPNVFLAHDKIPIECIHHGVYHQKACGHLIGAGCPQCGILKAASSHILTTEQFIAKSRMRWGDRFGYLNTQYVAKGVDLSVTCPFHGEVMMTPQVHWNSKHGCPKCNIDVPLARRKQELLSKARIVHSGRFDYSKVITLSTNEKVEIVCPDHGPFWQTLYDHAVKQTDCPKCAIAADRLSYEEFVSNAQALYGNRYDYSKVVLGTVASLVTITCKEHGDFVQRAASHLAGNKCKKCFLDENKLSIDEFIKNAREVHGDSYDYGKVKYQGNKLPVEIICPTHGSFWQKPNAHVSSRAGCRFCYESKGEKAIEVALKKYGINHIREYRMVPHLFRYDFYLPGLNIFIEFHGQQHYHPVAIFGGEEAFQQNQERDETKKLLVQASGAKLVVLTYLNLTEGSVEKELIRRLKGVYRHWYLIDGELKVYRTSMEAAKAFNVPGNLPLRNIDMWVVEHVIAASVLF